MRTCHLKCDQCGAESGAQKALVSLLTWAVEAGWAVNRLEDKDRCPSCRARSSLETWEPTAPRPVAPPAAADLTWGDA